jgi:hypothetical protein
MQYEIDPKGTFVKLADKALPTIKLLDTTNNATDTWAVDFVGANKIVLWGLPMIDPKAPASIPFVKE